MTTYNQYSDLPNSEYFKKNSSRYNNEREFYDLLLTEAYNKFGISLVYYTTTYDTSYNKIFAEDGNRFFVRKFDIMGFCEIPKEMQYWNNFGIEDLDIFPIFVSKRHFYRASRVSNNTAYTPKVGDVIEILYKIMDHDTNLYTNHSRFYEIIDIGQEDGMFLQQKHTWTFMVRIYRDTHVLLSASTSATMTNLDDYTNKDDDIFSLSADIDTAKNDILYDKPDTETGQDSIFGDW